MKHFNVNCSVCSTEYSAFIYVDNDAELGDVICYDCATKCDGCGEIVTNDDIRTIGMTDVCNDCFDNNYYTCESCDEYKHIDVQSYEVNTQGRETQSWCQDCVDNNAFECEDCNDIYSDYHNESSYTRHDNIVCPNCRDNYSWCDGCDQLTPQDEFDYDNDVCEVCHEDDEEEDCMDDDDFNSPRHRQRTIHNYGYKPIPAFITQDKVLTDGGKTLFFGMELEVENKGCEDTSELAQYVIDNCDYVYNKHDASLTEQGFEIVSDPIEAKDFNKLYPYGIINHLKDNEVRSWDAGNCGIHVHMSKAAFSSAHMYKFLKFIYLNQIEVQRFAGRKTNYASFDGQNEKVMNLVKGIDHTYHMNAVNITRHTLEVRVFKGTMNTQRIRSIIDFLNALFDYTKTLTAKDILEGRLQWNAFADYAKGNAVQYPTLVLRKEIENAEPFIVQAYEFKVSLKAVDAIVDNMFDQEERELS